VKGVMLMKKEFIKLLDMLTDREIAYLYEFANKLFLEK
jgi:hypothetical protein